MNTPSKESQKILEVLSQAVNEALHKKKLLGQYAVIWRNNKVERIDYGSHQKQK